MTLSITSEALFSACSDTSEDGGVTIQSVLEPMAGAGAPVKPAIYAGGSFQVESRWDFAADPPTPVDVIVLDNTPSQANRLEAALLVNRELLGLPQVVLDLSAFALPPHLPKSISSFQFPHRQADAYLRDATLEGKPFTTVPVGQALLAATADNPLALLEWFPQACIFGFWQSHLGKRRSQAKLARSWVAEIVGYRPAQVDRKVKGMKGDPLTLSVDEPAVYDPEDLMGADAWSLTEGAKKAAGSKKRERLSELGHGPVPTEGALGPVSFQRIEQRATVSFASLRRVSLPAGAGGRDAATAARALLVAIGIVAHVAAFGRPFTLRSGCDLRQIATDWSWLGTSRETVPALDMEGAVQLYRGCVDRAESEGLPVGSRWPREALVLEPAPNLASAIRRTWDIDGAE